MGRSPCCSKEGLNRGAWTAMEDNLLSSYVKAYGEGKWRSLPNRAGLKRCGKSCRLRWLNYLRPDIKRGNITDDEEELIIRLHKLLGNRWSLIAGRLPGRTDNEIKNYWNTTLAKKVKQPSSPACEEEQVQHPWSSRSRASQHLTLTQPQVIQTKATRCRNVVILPPPPSPLLNQNINIQFHHHDDGHQLGTSQYSTNQSQGEHAPTPKPQVNDEAERHPRESQSWEVNSLEGNGGDFCRDLFNLDMIGSSSMVLEGHGELSVNGWTTSAINASPEDHNATMNLDSLALFLDSGDWP